MIRLLSPSWFISTAISIPVLAILLWVMQYRPSEIRCLFRMTQGGSSHNGYLALAALRKYFIVSGLIVFVGNIRILIRSLCEPCEMPAGLITATIGISFSLLFAYPICGFWMRRLEKNHHLPPFSFRVGFRDDRTMLYLLAAIGIVFILMVIFVAMVIFRIPILLWESR